MLLETEWKRKIKAKKDETEKVVFKMRTVKKEIKLDHLKHLEKELKFYCNLNKNLEREIHKREDELQKESSDLKKKQLFGNESYKEKQLAIEKLEDCYENLMDEKFRVRKEFNQLILEEELNMVVANKRPERKPKIVRGPTKKERSDWEKLKENIKSQVEEIQKKEAVHKEIFEMDPSVEELQGLDYTDNKEILLTIDCETEEDEDVMFYSLGGRNLELYLELEAISEQHFFGKLESAIKKTFKEGKGDFPSDVFIKRMVHSEGGRFPRVLAKTLAEMFIRILVRNEVSVRVKKNKKKKINQAKTKLVNNRKLLMDFIQKNLQYKVYMQREGNERNYLEKVKAVLEKISTVVFSKEDKKKTQEPWVRYILIHHKGFSSEEASLIMGGVFWNVRQSKNISIEDVPRMLRKFVHFLAKKLKEIEDKELECAALKIQGVFRVKKAKQKVAQMKKKQYKSSEDIEEDIKECKEDLTDEIKEEIIEEEIEEDLDGTSRHSHQEEEINEILEEFQEEDIPEGLNQVPCHQLTKEEREKQEEEAAALKIQILYRRKRANEKEQREKRKREKEKREREKREEEKAALKIQILYRKKMALKKEREQREQKEKEEREQKEREEKELAEAALKIQTVFRRKEARKEVDRLREEASKQRREEEEAAINIQSIYKAREELQKSNTPN